MARTRLLTVFGAVALVSTGSALAATIVGTARDDVLRGTSRADRLYGKAGDDRLFGFGGKDVLVGGPGSDRLVGGKGADVLVCGPGRDIARADAGDKVAGDCEIVRGREPPPRPPAQAGTYCGSTNQGMPLCFDVAVGDGPTERIIARMELSVQAECQPVRQLERSFEVQPARAVVDADGSFVAPALVAGFTSTVEGAFDPSRPSAAGSLRVRFAEQQSGVGYECDSGVVSWTARTPPPSVAAQVGTFCGFTDQGLRLCFAVAGSFKTVTNLELLVRTECTPAATLGVSSTIPATYAIGEDGRFSFRRRGFGTTPDGGSFRVEHAMTGAFDASGTSATGTLSATIAYDAADGTHYECVSNGFAWSASRQ